MENIEKILLEISKTLIRVLKEIRDIHKERLDLEKEAMRENKEGMEEAIKIRDWMIGKGEKLEEDIKDSLGIKEKIDVDDIELLGDDSDK